MKFLNWLTVLLLAAALTGCKQPPPPKVDLAAEEAAIRNTDAQFLAAAKSRDADKTASFWSDDASLFPPNSAAITGKQAIRAYVGGAFASPDFSVTWTADKVVVANSGDMAYETGSDQLTYRTPDGKLVSEKTHGLVVWRKQADGNWKAAVDMWNADAQPGPSKAAAKKQ